MSNCYIRPNSVIYLIRLRYAAFSVPLLRCSFLLFTCIVRVDGSAFCLNTRSLAAISFWFAYVVVPSSFLFVAVFSDSPLLLLLLPPLRFVLLYQSPYEFCHLGLDCSRTCLLFPLSCRSIANIFQTSNRAHSKSVHCSADRSSSYCATARPICSHMCRKCMEPISIYILKPILPKELMSTLSVSSIFYFYRSGPPLTRLSIPLWGEFSWCGTIQSLDTGNTFIGSQLFVRV